MPAITSTAPGKIILFGEHAVVYGRPAIAVPVERVRARTIVIANPLSPAGNVHIQAPDIGLDAALSDLSPDHPITIAVKLVLETTGTDHSPACTIRISSTIPLASGMGSGAAVSVSFIRAFSGFLGHPLSDEQVNSLAYEVEKIFHGTPSGIDNTVITYAQPVYFQQGSPTEVLNPADKLIFVIGDTGLRTPTSTTVGDVRQAWENDPQSLEILFDEIGRIGEDAKSAVQSTNLVEIGRLMNDNHSCLQAMGVSSTELDKLVESALAAGAVGAKMSGGGRGGNMIALVRLEKKLQVVDALDRAGAVGTIITEVSA